MSYCTFESPIASTDVYESLIDVDIDVRPRLTESAGLTSLAILFAAGLRMLLQYTIKYVGVILRLYNQSTLIMIKTARPLRRSMLAVDDGCERCFRPATARCIEPVQYMSSTIACIEFKRYFRLLTHAQSNVNI